MKLLPSHTIAAWIISLVSFGATGVQLDRFAQRWHARSSQLFVGNVTQELDLDQRALQMPLESALELMHRKSGVAKQLTAFIDDVLREHGTTAAKVRKANPVGLGAAEAMLSEMLAESRIKLDTEKERCIDFHATQTEQIEQARQAISEAQAQYAGGRAEKLRAQAQITYIDGKQPQMESELQNHNNQCAEDLAAIEGQLTVVKQDTQVMEGILNMSKCAGSDSSFIQAETVPCCKTANKTSLFMSRTRVSPLGRLRSAAAKFLVQQAFAVTTLSLSDVSQGLALEQDYDMQMVEQQAMEYYVLEEDIPRTTTPMPVIQPRVCPQQAQGKCTIADSPSCPRIQNKFVSIHAGIVEKCRQLAEERQNTRHYCEQNKKTLESQIEALEVQRSDEETALAKAISEINEAEGTVRLMQRRSAELNKELLAQLQGCTVLHEEITYEMVPDSGECAVAIHEYEAEMCGLKRIRVELAKVQGHKIYSTDIIDCEVGEWTEGTCSKSCGGGTMTKRRAVVVNPNAAGAECPPLEIEEACNYLPCPIDCVVDAWAEWSACSASCAAGVRERQRAIKVHPAFAGEPCDATTEAENCNLQSCDQDCVLAEWCEWSGCSKVCGGGTQKRLRPVAEEAAGSGLCAAEDEPERLEFYECNTQSCADMFELNESRPFLACKAKVDVMLLLDGSGSLDEKGWNASTEAAKALTNGLRGGPDQVEMAMLLFSGPTGVRDMDVCMGNRPAPSEWDEMGRCKMQWVSHFTDDMPTVDTAIDGLSFPSGSALTAKALGMAAEELSNGREDAEVVVIVVTDGQPNDESNVQEAVANLRKAGARVMWVLVGSEAAAAYRKVTPWASLPLEENIIEVANATMLPSADTINAIISNFCPVLE